MNPTSRLDKLALLQAEYYDIGRYLARVRRPVGSDLCKRMKMTTRLRLTNTLSRVVGIVAANAVIGLPVALAHRYQWWWCRLRVGSLKRKGLKVVAIAGSYGKTSVKNILYDILRSHYRTVITPESYNTVAGIYKTLRWEVDGKTKVFIAEVGAYHVGDITELARMIQPDIGVLTGIARQHLERFGSYENILRAKTEIARYIHETGGILVANGADTVVRSQVGQARWYTGQSRDAINRAGAIATAQTIGMNTRQIEEALATVRQVPHRFEMTTDRYGMKVIDDSFSSNDVGFVDAVNTLSLKKENTRILVTPGLVELGTESVALHEKLGALLPGKIDILILVGESERTQALERGAAGKVPIYHIDATLEFMEKVRSLKLSKEPFVLLENDVTENYN